MSRLRSEVTVSLLGKVYVGLDTAELDFGQIPAGITKIVLKAENGESFEAGDDSGRVLEKECIFGSQEMADNILEMVRDVVYQPFSGTDALLDLAAEVGDNVVIDGVESAICQTSITFDKMCAADIAAPTSDDLDDEYPYESVEKRNLKRLNNKIENLNDRISDLEDIVKNPGEGPEDGYVISFNGRDGVVVPEKEDYLKFIVEEIQEAIYESWKAKY